MEKEITHLKQIVLSLPEKPGVYQYLNAKDEIIRLQSGTYVIEETKAPQGYAVNGNLIEITIDATYGDTFVNGSYVTNCTENGTASVEIVNFPIVLPATGGMGTAIFSIVSGISAVGAIVLFVVYRKKRASEANN